MLSINGMLGPTSPVPQRTSEPEDRHFSRTPPSASAMSRPHDHTGIQTLLNAATSSVPISPEQSYPHQRSFSEEITTIPHSQPPQNQKRKAYVICEEQTPSPDRTRFTASSSPVPKKKRAPRPQYTKEQEDFIWFCRDDLAMSWRKVVQLYNNHWHPFEVEPHIRSESGLQSRYYRILDFPVKIRKKKEPSRPDLGLIPSTNRRYPWMGVIMAGIEERKKAERNARYTTTVQKNLQVCSANSHDEDEEDEEGSGSETEGLRSESDTEHSTKDLRKEHWNRSLHNATSTDVRGNRGSRVILHASEADGGVEPEQEWENSRQSTVSSHDRCDLKSLNSCEDPLDTIKGRFQPSIFMTEGPIRLPPLRRHFPTSNETYDRGMTDEFRKGTYEMSASNHVCKISVINLCI